MRIVLGWIPPSAGQVVLDGFDGLRHIREARARLGGLIEVPAFYPGLSGQRNIELLSRLSGRGKSDAQAEARRLIEQVGLTTAATRPVGQWSLGMRQRLGIASALVGDPELVLLDEPTSGLDPEGIADLREWIRRLVRDEGKTVLLSSHRLTELEGMCNRIGILRQGRVMLESSTEALAKAAAGEYVVAAGEEAAAADLETRLAELGLQSRAAVDAPVAGARQITIGDRDPAQLSRDLVDASGGLHLWTPRSASLEEVYARATRGELAATRDALVDQGATNGPSSPAATRVALPSPGELRAPSAPIRRMLRHELARALTRKSILAAMLVPAAAGAVAIWRRSDASQQNLDAIGGEDLFSDTSVTAFEAFGVGMSAGLPLLALILVAISSQSLAAELGRGTLRNLLLAPITRTQLVLGKAAAMLTLTILSYLLLVASSLSTAAGVFDFKAVVEVLPGGLEFPLVPLEELWPQLQQALSLPLPPLLAFCGIGLLASACARNGAFALGLSLAIVLGLELMRGIARGLGLESWLPTAHVPSPLGDSSFIGSYRLAVTGVSNVEYTLHQASVVAPLGWLAMAGLLTLWIMRKRYVS
ncbi:MAG: ABC-type multidrug transport system ATPase subunit [Planctomycetota bacterium]|jgi:ABC-type multidrug transport system ATPase subunit